MVWSDQLTSNRISRFALIVIVALGAVLRFFRLDHGLPEMVAADAFKFVDEAARMASSGNWTPQIFQYPGLFTHLLALLDLIFDPQSLYWRHLSASIVAATAGILLIGATYLLARRLCGGATALLAALLTAVSPSFVTYSRTPAPDILMTLFITLCLWLLLDGHPRLRTSIAAGICAGLAIGAKFTALYLLPFLAVVPLVIATGIPLKKRLLHPLISLASLIITFSLTTPQFWFHAGRYAERLLREAATQKYGQIGRVHSGWFDYFFSSTPTWEQPWLGTSIATNLGWPLLVAILAAFAFGLWSQRETRILAVFAIAFMALISGPGHLKAYRFLLPILPALFVLVAWGFENAVHRLRNWATVVLAAFMLATPIVHTFSYLRLTLQPTTNEIAADWIRQHVEAGTPTLLSPFFVSNLARQNITAVAISNVGSRQYGRPAEIGPSPERDPIYKPEMLGVLQTQGVGLIITNSYFDDAFSPVRENLAYFPISVRQYARWEERLHGEGSLLITIDGFSAHRMGPDIEIWQLP